MKDLSDLFRHIFGDDGEEFINKRFNNSSFFSSMSIRNFNFGEGADGFPKDGDKNFNKTVETSETPSHTIKKEIWTSIDGKQRYERITHLSNGVDKTKKNTKEELETKLQTAIKEQRYEDACKIRDEIKAL